MRTTKASENLAGWVAVRCDSQDAAAELFGCSRPHLTNILAGKSRPGGFLQKRIQDATGGAVAMPDWYVDLTPEEAPHAA